MITIDGSQGEGGGQILRTSLALETEHVTEVFTVFGERGRPAEEVARSAVEAARAWLGAGVPVDEHLADQLLIPLVLAGGGSFRTTRPSLRTTTNGEVIQRFLPVPICLNQESEVVWRVQAGAHINKCTK